MTDLRNIVSTLRTAVGVFAPQDTYHRLEWVPPSSLSTPAASCSVNTLDQLEAFLAPVLHSPKVDIHQSNRSPHRTLFEYTDAQKTSQHILVEYNQITRFDRNQSCTINYRLAYYLMAGTSYFPAPQFARNAFDTAVVNYMRCLQEDANSCGMFATVGWGNSDSEANLSHFPFKPFEATLDNPNGTFKLSYLYYSKFHRTVLEFTQYFLASLEDEVPSIRNHHREYLEALIDAANIKSLSRFSNDANKAELKRRYDVLRHYLATLLNTPVGRAKFWELRDHLPVKCTKERSASDDIVEVVCRSSELNLERKLAIHTGATPIQSTQTP
ncbi:MAG: hypothetical protein COV45_08165 [Deltaproteobacteria bacterium CG11_big_fil_rev_8_21_14_0_20_47_16]|nr:MAG: hypothetical protein COV45_08165 [Deltaproteobacteria bacterium CG11_big_fil_rev_8_21_14_0_20_47_16]